MKKKIETFAKQMGISVSISGKQWPTTAFVDHPAYGKDWAVTEMIKRFTRHSQIKFQ